MRHTPARRNSTTTPLAEVFRAWSPYLALTVMVLLWGIPSIKAELDKSKVVITVAGLDNMIVKKVSKPEDGLKKIAAVNAEADKLLATLPCQPSRSWPGSSPC